METPCVLSIQSHVVHGYVGNKSATFPLQVLGLEVDAINSVQLSNHTGYKVIKGQILNENDLGDLADGLAGNNINKYSHLLTGYVGNPAFLKRIGQLTQHLKKHNPNLIYVCDPVMGDNGKMYVPESLLPIYRDEIIPLADIITPNQYEVELLTGKKLNNIDDAWSAINDFHEKGCGIVIISSSDLGNSEELLCFASSRIGGTSKRVIAKVPKLSNTFTGTGDLFSALFLGWMYKTGDVSQALNNTLATLQAVLKRTLSSAEAICGSRAPTIEDLELRLIQSKKDIENPSETVYCETVA